MRVLFLNENLGGHATVHVNLAKALSDDSRVAPTFVNVPAPGLVRRVVSATLPFLGRRDLDLQPLRAQLALSAEARRLVRRRAGTFDVLHVYTQNAALLLVGAMRQVPTVVSTDSTNRLNQYVLPYRSPTPWTPLALRLTLPFERRVFDAARLIVAQSRYVADSLRDDYQIGASKVRTLRFGVIGPPQAVAAPGRAIPVITFVGESLERKGGNRLLRVFARSFADRARLVLVTREAVAPTPGVRVVNDLRPGDSRLWTLLGESSIFALPSEMDQSPNAVLEAMAAGLPIVAVRTGALAEMVDDGVNGLLIDGNDEALRVALDRLVTDADLRARMGAAARRAHESFWDAKRQARQLVDLLLEAAGPSTTGRR